MSTKPNSVNVTIMGKEYRIVCPPEEQDELLQSAQQLDLQMRKLRDSGKVNGPERVAVLTALNLAYELQSVKNQNISLKQQLHTNLTQLNQKLENVLENR